MRGIKDKLTAGIVVVVGMALIRTNANPQLWQMALISIGLYETVLLFFRASREIPQERSRRQIRTENIRINHRNGQNLKKKWLGGYWPMREVM